MNTTTTTTKTTPEFEISPGAAPLLAQLEAFLPREVMCRSALGAAVTLETISDMSAELQQSEVALFSLAVLQATDLTSEASVSVAITAAALLGAAKAGPGTATERVRSALCDIAERYDADL